MGPVPRSTVLQAVELYGTAWTTQDPLLLPKLFTSDAIYVERAFDKNATLRGLEAIAQYWSYQIVGKQSNIAFRHVAAEMVRDADEPMAVVKWLAEFDNRRENRAGKESDKTHKRVKFCQVAKLVFRDGKICYLEEYTQAMNGPGVRWPGLGKDVTDADLAARIRQDPEQNKVPNKDNACNRCGMNFPSRTQLFRHLKSTQERDNGKCVPIEQAEEDSFAWICLSLGYLCSEGLDDMLLQSLLLLATERSEESSCIDKESMAWAVPPDSSLSAVVNVASVKLSKAFLRKLETGDLPSLLYPRLKDVGIRIHKAVLVDRPCVPERREFEKYEAFVPWRTMQGGTLDDTESDISSKKGWNRQSGHCRRPLSETAAFPYVDAEIAKRLRDGARLLKDCGNPDLGHYADENNPDELKVRIRTRTMEEPWHQFCRISVSMRQPGPGIVENLIELLLGYGCSVLGEDELVSGASKVMSAKNLQVSTQFNIDTKSVCLLEPALSRYEGKIGAKLCGDSKHLPKEMEGSIELMETAVLAAIEKKYRNSQGGT